MIKLVKTGLLSVALLASVVANASKIVTVNSPGKKVVNITLSDVSNGETLSITDIDGKVLLEETLIEADSFIKTINFSPLQEGVYFLKTTKSNEINVTPILINSDNVSIVPNSIKTYSAPKIILDNSVAKIFANNFTKERVSMSIYDNSGTEINLESSKDLIVYRFFDFEKLGPGTYTISTTIGNYEFTDEITF